ncbi:MAG: tetraacyldisaccharide 4'-kinase [bacterium]
MVNYIQEIIFGKERGNKLILFVLDILSFFYYIVIEIKLLLYKTGIMNQHHGRAKVVSIGNITLGGTGKTPAVIQIANLFQDKKVVILSRGYKSSYEHKMAVVSDGKQIFLTPSEAGDEPYLLAKKLPHIPVIIGKNRIKSATYARDRFKAEIIILDDGFQYWRLRRNLDIVLIDGKNPFGNNALFPMGIMREPIKNLKRADIFIITKIDQSLNRNEIIQNLKRINLKAPILESIHKPIKFIEFDSKKEYPLEFIKDLDILALSSIADPDSFETILKKLTTKKFIHLKFPDHYVYTKNDINKLIDYLQGVSFIVTTEKDMVRLQDLIPDDLPIIYLMIEFEIITPNWQELILEYLKN